MAVPVARTSPGSGRDILDLTKYEYWLGSWTSDLSQLTDDSAIVKASVTELSIAWSPYLNKYVMLDGDSSIRIRTAPQPWGPWSPARIPCPLSPPSSTDR